MSEDAFVQLPDGFILTSANGDWKIEHSNAGISYTCPPPESYFFFGDWIRAVERNANASPGRFISTLMGADINGEHRRASEALHGSSNDSTYNSSRGSGSGNSDITTTITTIGAGGSGGPCGASSYGTYQTLNAPAHGN